jgi:O-antigen ligase
VRVAAIVLAGGLMASTRSPLQRLALAAAVMILVAGLIGTASRGGTLAAGVTILVAMVVFRRRRALILAIATVAASVVALTFVYAPGSWERVTDFDDDNGRSDLWYVGWEMWKDNPVAGVGIGNFIIHIPDYVQTPGGVEDVGNLVDEPHFVHNTYLQMLTDGGVVAMVLFLGVVIACLRATMQAAALFARRGKHALETLAKSTLVATISMLVASIFLSAAQDPRLWLLLALGPALLTVAREDDEESLGEADHPDPERVTQAPSRPRLLRA